jgi:hypothetical protein
MRDGYEPIVRLLGLPDSENPARFYEEDPYLAPVGSGSQPSQLADRAKQGAQQGNAWLATRGMQEQFIVDAIKQAAARRSEVRAGRPRYGRRAAQIFLEMSKRAEADQATLARSPGGVAGFDSQARRRRCGRHLPRSAKHRRRFADPRRRQDITSVAARDALINADDRGRRAAGGRAKPRRSRRAIYAGRRPPRTSPAQRGGRCSARRSTSPARDRNGEPALGNDRPRQQPGVQDLRGDCRSGQARSGAGRPEVGQADQTRRNDSTTCSAELDNRELADVNRQRRARRQADPRRNRRRQCVERAQDVGESSPFQAGPVGDGVHEGGLAAALKDLEDGVAGRAQPMTVSSYVDAYMRGEGRDDPNMVQFGANNGPEIEAEFQRRAQAAGVGRPPADLSTRPAAAASNTRRRSPASRSKVGGAENATGNIHDKNPLSSASGPAQFTDDTFRDYYRKIYGPIPARTRRGRSRTIRGAGEAHWRLPATMRRSSRGSARRSTTAISIRAFPRTPARPRVFKAAPETPIELDPVGRRAHRNPFLKGKSASETIAWAHAKMGAAVRRRSVPAPASPRPSTPASEDPRDRAAPRRGDAARRQRDRPDPAARWIPGQPLFDAASRCRADPGRRRPFPVQERRRRRRRHRAASRRRPNGIPRSPGA